MGPLALQDWTTAIKKENQGLGHEPCEHRGQRNGFSEQCIAPEPAANGGAWRQRLACLKTRALWS